MENNEDYLLNDSSEINSESNKYETIHTSLMRSSISSKSLKYLGTFKEFKIEELLQDTLPVYFIYTDIE